MTSLESSVSDATMWGIALELSITILEASDDSRGVIYKCMCRYTPMRKIASGFEENSAKVNEHSFTMFMVQVSLMVTFN
jgi:hypothetical protein